MMADGRAVRSGVTSVARPARGSLRVWSARAAVGLGATAAVVHAAPSLTVLRRLRTRVTPVLAGVGAPDHVALTFDDGPDPVSTPLFLEVLTELDVRATFFVLGSQVQRTPDLVRRTVAAGHELAVHAWDHRPMVLCGPLDTYRQLRRTRDLITAVTGREPRFTRPPHGILSTGFLLAAARLHLTPVLWTAWGRDWTAAATPSSVLATLAPDLRGGGTILLHDCDCTSAPQAWRSALGALPELVARCHDRGLRMGPLAEHGLGSRQAAPTGGVRSAPRVWTAPRRPEPQAGSQTSGYRE
jgi:peptidoglycan/xylan/chitin deacetylase (PgdA/CDA1 family)